MESALSDAAARILIVDDDPRNRRLMDGIFRACGYRTEMASSGPEALISVSQQPPDLVLLDVMMPEMSGREVCRRLKESEQTRPIPVMLVTALSSVEDKVEGLDLGADDFVSKPVNRVELLAKARSLLRVKRLHDEMLRGKLELAGKNEELERLERLKESLVQMIVHDLKNPLTAIVGNLSLILQSASSRSEEDERRIESALQSSRVMMKMILDLLDVSRLEENKLEVRAEPVEVAPLIHALVLENGGLLAAGAIDVRQELDPRTAHVMADPDLIGRVLGNLLSNAIRHTPSGGTITIGCEPGDSEVVLRVQDTGNGIAEPDRYRIFEKFFRAGQASGGQGNSRGLGLTFCRMAVEAHGGRMWLETAPGQGASFYLALPS